MRKSDMFLIFAIMISFLLLMTSGCSLKYVAYNPQKYEPCHYRDPDTWKLYRGMCLKEEYWEESRK